MSKITMPDIPAVSRALQIPQGAGIKSGTKPALLLATMIADDSGSISSYGNAPAIRRGHNAQLANYRAATNNLLVRTRYLNGTELFDYSTPRDAVPMDDHNYNPQLGTPLYDQSYLALKEVMRSAKLFASGYDVFTMTCIMTDGCDFRSVRKGPQDVRAVVERLFASGRHIVAGIGVRDDRTDFSRVFADMGIPEQWIMVLEREEGDIVSGMTHFSQTTGTVVDQNSFTKTCTTGFASPRSPGRRGNC